MDIVNVIDQMLILLILLAVGFIANKTHITDAEINAKLTNIILTIFQTAMILDAVADKSLQLGLLDTLWVMCIACISYVIMLALSFFVPRILRVPREKRGLYSFMTIFSNVGFMGFPVVASLFGKQAVLYAALFAIPFNLLAYSIGIGLMSGGWRNCFDLKKMINVPLFATVVALIVLALDIDFPYPVAAAITSLGDMVVPASMLVIGGSLGSMKVRDIFSDWRVYALLPFRLIVAPVLVWALLRLFVHDEMLLGIATVLTAMPVAAISTMFAIQYGGDEQTASKSVFVSTVISVATTPLIVYLLLL